MSGNKLFFSALVGATMALSMPALAGECPHLVEEIELAMSMETHADPHVVEKIQKHLAEGKELHAAGKHDESLKELNEALEMLEGHEKKDH